MQKYNIFLIFQEGKSTYSVFSALILLTYSVLFVIKIATYSIFQQKKTSTYSVFEDYLTKKAAEI